MVEIDLISLVVTGVVAAGASFFGSYLMWSFIGPRVVKRGIARELGPSMLHWLFEPSIKTGKKVVEKRERSDGTILEKEVDEVIAPGEELARRMAYIIQRMTLSKLGVDGTKKAAMIADLQAELANPDSPFAQFAGFLSPKARERALKDGDYVPVLLDLIVSSPQARELVGKAINRFKGSSSTSSADTSAMSGVSGKTW